MASPPRPRSGPGARPTASPRSPATRANAGPRRGKRPAPARGGLDFFHLLAAASGAFCGLALFSVMSPGHVPGRPPAGVGVGRSAARDVLPQRVHGALAPDGLFHVAGQLYNAGQGICHRASVTIRFFDARGKVVTSTLSEAREIPASKTRAFDAQAHVPGAVRYDVTVDWAQF